jgi:hypothetical protein
MRTAMSSSTRTLLGGNQQQAELLRQVREPSRKPPIRAHQIWKALSENALTTIRIVAVELARC